jgi:hypothetical protein
MNPYDQSDQLQTQEINNEIRLPRTTHQARKGVDSPIRANDLSETQRCFCHPHLL